MEQGQLAAVKSEEDLFVPHCPICRYDCTMRQFASKDVQKVATDETIADSAKIHNGNPR